MGTDELPSNGRSDVDGSVPGHVAGMVGTLASSYRVALASADP